MPTGVPLDLQQFQAAGIDICAIVELAIESPRPGFNHGPAHWIRPLQQVTLRIDKISERGLIRLGQTPGDEANCWIRPEHINVIEILGRAEREPASNAEGKREKWNVVPLAADTGSAQQAA